MIIETLEVKKILDDYDILFSSGFMLPLTIDLSLGDTISFDDKAILIYLAPRQSQADPKKVLAAKDITVFTPHIISIEHRSREVTELNLEQKADLNKTWKNLITHNTVQ